MLNSENQIKSESLWENNGRQRSKISESPSRLKHYCIVIWHFQYNRYIRKLHLSCIDHYDSHVLWKTVNIWRQIPYKYWSLLLISGSFECREVFLSQIYSVVSWRSSGWSDTVKKSKAFGGSQKWTFDSQQSKLSEVKTGLSLENMGEQRVLEEAQAELSKRMKALADPAALAMKSTRFILRQRWWAWMSISHNIFDIQGVCYLAWTPLLYLESSWTELFPLVLSQSHPLPSILLRKKYKS